MKEGEAEIEEHLDRGLVGFTSLVKAHPTPTGWAFSHAVKHEVQNGLIERDAGLPSERRIEFRVGVHLGDAVEEADGDLFGDGVNITARLESVAEPGAICLSEQAYWGRGGSMRRPAIEANRNYPAAYFFLGLRSLVDWTSHVPRSRSGSRSTHPSPSPAAAPPGRR